MRNVKTLGAVASALVLTAGLATTASAAEMKFKVSGYYKGAFIVSSLNDGYQGTAVGSDGEIHFSPSIKTDNGRDLWRSDRIGGVYNQRPNRRTLYLCQRRFRYDQNRC